MSSETQPSASEQTKTPLTAARRCICGHPYTKGHKQVHPPPSENLTTAFATTKCWPCESASLPCIVYVDAKTDLYHQGGCLDCNSDWCTAGYETGSYNTTSLLKSTKDHTQFFMDKVWYYASYKQLEDGSEEYTFSRDLPGHDTVGLPNPPVLTERTMAFLGGCATSIVITVRPLVKDEDIETSELMPIQLKREKHRKEW